MFVDTHCHIHEDGYDNPDQALERARAAGVADVMVVGTNEKSSQQAVDFATSHSNAYATIGVHPHDTKDGWDGIRSLAKNEKVVAVGEIGLDYYYDNSPREMQIQALKDQIQVALDNDLPIVFHVREAFSDFWPIFDSFTGIRGELHSFTDTIETLQQALDRGLYIGVNGISTFTKDEKQKAMFAAIPLDKMLLETDAPFLTPVPFRGKVNEPAYVRNVAEFQANLHGVSLEALAKQTTANAHTLFAF